MATKNDIHQRALALLANREHSSEELSNKLANKFAGHSDVIEDVIIELQDRNHLSDSRFACSMISYRARKGYGPIWISSYLKGKGVSSETIREAFDEADLDWDEMICLVRKKKFGNNKIENYKDKAKEMVFLQTRGFSKSQIYSLYNLD